MILRDGETRFTLSFTSGGAANAEMWIRDWIDTWGLRVHVLDRTMSLAAINVTGPLAGELLRRAGLAEPPRFLGHVRADVAGVPCHVMRLSFTGEAAWELHHPIDRSVELWRALMDLGRDLGIRPHGLQALFALRLEKGHVIVGMDTDLDSTPRRLGMDWAVRMEKPRFIGRAALERTAKLPDHRRWMGFTMDGAEPAPVEGSPIWYDGEIVGNVTGSWHSPVLGTDADPRLAARTAVRRPRDDRRPRGGRRTDPLLRPGGPPCPRLSRSQGLRVVADPAAIDSMRWVRSRHRPSSSASLPTTRSSRRHRSRRRRPARDHRGRARVRRWLVRHRCHPATPRVVAPDRATGARPGFDRRRPREAVPARWRRRACRDHRRLRREPRRAPRLVAT